MLGNGLGSFGAATPATVGAGDQTFSVSVGDFNGDTFLDLAVAKANVDNISILLGTGNGSFGTATNIAVGDGPNSVAVGEFDGL